MSEMLRRLSRPIGELVERRALLVAESEPLFGVVVRMREAGDTAAIVVDADGQVAGMLTAEDVLERTLFEPNQPVAALRRRVPPLRAHDRVYQALADMRRQ